MAIESLIVAMAKILGVYWLFAAGCDANITLPNRPHRTGVSSPQHPAVVHLAVSTGDRETLAPLDPALHVLKVGLGWDRNQPN